MNRRTNSQARASVGPTTKPGGGFIAEESGVGGTLAIKIRWSAKIIRGIPAEGLTTTVYNRFATLDCPITSSDEVSYSYFAMIDNPDGEPMAATGFYQPWWNEDCTGTLKIDDTYHADDPTLAGPEPIVHTNGTRPLRRPWRQWTSPARGRSVAAIKRSTLKAAFCRSTGPSRGWVLRPDDQFMARGWSTSRHGLQAWCKRI